MKFDNDKPLAEQIKTYRATEHGWSKEEECVYFEHDDFNHEHISTYLLIELARRQDALVEKVNLLSKLIMDRMEIDSY